MGANESLAHEWLNCVSCHWTVEDQKDLPSAVSPELRQKEVQMNFFNQLTSVFNPDLTTILGSPSAAHMQVSVGELLPHYCCPMVSISCPLRCFHPANYCFPLITIFSETLFVLMFADVSISYWTLVLLLFTGWEWLWWPDHRSGRPGQDEKCLCFSECVKLTGTWWALLTIAVVSSVMGSQACYLVAPCLHPH